MAAPSTPAAQALLDALADRPGATATELAQAAQIGRSTAAKLLATLASQDRVLRQPGGRRGGRPAADRWTLPTPDPTPNPGPPTAAPIRIAEPSATGAGRLGAGQLRQLVLSCLAERPGQALSPTAIAKTLDRSAGAVANALRVLAGQGMVVQTQLKPHRYTITTAGGDQADARPRP
jgi:predicted transcriptional regulator